jgi:RNA polymerase sigma factor (sigma-70 family)
MSSFAVVIAEVKGTVQNLPFPLINPADCGDGNPVNTESIVFVVDDDAFVREALSNLIRSVGLVVQTFPTAQAFLDSERPDAPACLVLDVRLPGKSGLDLQRELARGEGDPVPIVFITAHGDIPMSVRAMKAGAVEFLPKPFRDQDLLDAIAQALDRARRARHERTELANIQHCYQQLTPRECEIATLIVEGLRNKQVAARLGVSEMTVKVHRRKVLEKMRVRSLPQLSLLLKRIEAH